MKQSSVIFSLSIGYRAVRLNPARKVYITVVEQEDFGQYIPSTLIGIEYLDANLRSTGINRLPARICRLKSQLLLSPRLALLVCS
jgi:hypothetical protein